MQPLVTSDLIVTLNDKKDNMQSNICSLRCGKFEGVIHIGKYPEIYGRRERRLWQIQREKKK